MRYNEVFGGAVVLDGYRMLALVVEGFQFHAVLYREKADDFVFCYGYDIKDGTWCQGHYCLDYATALEELKKHI